METKRLDNAALAAGISPDYINAHGKPDVYKRQTQGIILTIQQHDQSDVWLADESQAGRVQAELARFLENPADPVSYTHLEIKLVPQKAEEERHG